MPFAVYITQELRYVDLVSLEGGTGFYLPHVEDKDLRLFSGAMNFAFPFASKGRIVTDVHIAERLKLPNICGGIAQRTNSAVRSQSGN